MKPRFGKYRLIAKLAQGGMAQVYLAEQRGLDGFLKKIVIKRMRGRDPSLMPMFGSEAVIAGQLNHPNLVHIYDYGETDGERFIAMEYVDGPSVKKLLWLAARRPVRLPMEHCLKIASLVCEGLAYAHTRRDDRTGAAMKLVHRDITPDNILLSRAGAVKIADFGIVKATTQLHETRAGEVKGKLQYIAPEQLKSEGVDARSDLFSLGVVLHEMLTGAGPFVRENDAAVMDAIVHDEVPPLNELRPEAPPVLDSIIRKATAKRREARFSSAIEMQEAIDTLLAKLSPGFGPAMLRDLVESLDPAPEPTGEEETTTDAEPFDDEATGPMPEGRRVTPEAMKSVEVPITGLQPALAPAPKAPRRWPLVLLAVVLSSSVTAVVTKLVVREMTPAVVLAPPEPEPKPVIIVVADEKPDAAVAVAPKPELPDAAVAVAEEPEAPAEPEEPEEAPAQPEPVKPEAEPAAELPGRARVTLQSTPEADVYLDGKAVGRTPLALPVKYGSHKLRFEEPQQFLSKTVALNVPEGREYNKAFVFQPARLFVMAPDGSTIFIGKRKAGRVPGPVSLYEGTYTVRVVYEPLGLDVTKKLELKGGDRFEPFEAAP